MKRFELSFTFAQLPLDYLMLVLAGFAAFGLRHAEFVTAVRPVLFTLRWEAYWPLVLFVALGWVIIFALAGLYSTDPNRKLAWELNRLIFASSTGFAAITVYVFFTLQKFDSRFLVLAGWILAVIFVSLGRIILRLIKMYCYERGYGLRRTIIIGGETVATRIAETIADRPALGYKLLANFEKFDEAAAKMITDLRPDEIIFADPRAGEEDALRAIDYANEHHITFKYSADLFATISSNMAISTLSGIPIVELRRTRLSGWGRIFKRIMDIVGSIFFILLLSPLFLLFAILIFMETGRPIFYKNERVGKAGKKFFALKFRSMYQKDCTGAGYGKDDLAAMEKEEALIRAQSIKPGPVYKIPNDPRVTPLGRFIRRWSIDELPQFFNVLKGEMSLVGPRPHQPREVAKYQKWQRDVLTIRPGLTGLAQISGRSNLSFDEEVRLDTFYMEHWNLFLDIIIILKTPFIILRSKGAY